MRRFLIFSFLSGLLFLLVAVAGYYFIDSKLPSEQEIQTIHLDVPLRVYSAEHTLMAEFGEKRRIPVAYKDIPEAMIHAFISSEDDRYFHHHGVDYLGLGRAVLQLIKTGRKSQGGSTITMQAARNFFLSNRKTYMRKFSEILLAMKMERILTKPQILQLYLNKIYLGNRSYGVGAAAQAYYGKRLSELTLAETAMIAGLPKAPSRYNPVVNAQRAKIRRDYVLGRMLALQYIDEAAYTQALQSSVTAMKHARVSEVSAPYVAEMVRAYMVEHYGKAAYTDGYNVTTTVHADLQAMANAAVRKNLINYDTRHGYRGVVASLVEGEKSVSAPENLSEASRKERYNAWMQAIRQYSEVGGLLPAVVIEVKEKSLIVLTRQGRQIFIPWQGLSWARPYLDDNHTGDAPKVAADIVQWGDVVRVTMSTTGKGYWRLAQVPQAEGALVSLNPKNGGITSLVGGFDFYRNKFNRVTQAKRQPGSNFKPFLYSAALEYGYTPASIINDSPVVFEDAALETAWRPENYSGKFFGPTRLRKALYTSRNLVSIRLLRALGTKRVINYVGSFGFKSDILPKNLSLALGSVTLPPLDIVRGYAVFANGGYRVEPYVIHSISDREGNELFTAKPLSVRCHPCEGSTASQVQEPMPENNAPRVIEERNVYLITSILRDVIAKGTGRRARVLERKDLAGKTGTTNDQKDAWFSGFNKDIVATAWVGFDKVRSLGRKETGSRAALPMWIEFMKQALPQFPEEVVWRPAGLATVSIDPLTGQRVRAGAAEAMLEIFREENIPEYESRDVQGENGVRALSQELPETVF